MDFDTFVKWLKNDPKNSTKFVVLASIMIICGTVCVSQMASCEAKHSEYRYRYLEKTSEAFWNRNKVSK